MTTRKDIENALMRGADTLRDTIDAANYKDYVLHTERALKVKIANKFITFAPLN